MYKTLKRIITGAVGAAALASCTTPYHYPACEGEKFLHKEYRLNDLDEVLMEKSDFPVMEDDTPSPGISN